MAVALPVGRGGNARSITSFLAFGSLILALLCACENPIAVSDKAGGPRLITFGDFYPLADFDAEMARPRLPLVVDGVTMDSCADLFAAIEAGADFPTASWAGTFADYETCFELPLLCHAPVPMENPWHTEGLAEEIYRHFDLRGVGWSLGPPRPAVSFHYRDFALPAPEISGDGFSIETEDFYYALWPTAIGDFDGNGVADVLVTVFDHAKRTDDFDISPIVLSRKTTSLDIRGRRVFEAVLGGTLATWPEDPMTCNRAD